MGGVLIRSSPPSRSNNIRGENVRPSVGRPTSVRPQKVFFSILMKFDM